MTTREVSAEQAADVIERCAEVGLRLPENRGGPGAARTLVWEPDLTLDELLMLSAATSAVRLAPSEYAVVREQMLTLRALRQLGRNAFMALTAAERDRQLYDAHVATTIVLLALLRD